MNLARLRIQWISIKSGKHRMVYLCLSDVRTVQAVEEEEMNRYIIQFIGESDEVLMELAVGCQHERDRILHFFSSLLKWCDENKNSKLFEKVRELDEEDGVSYYKKLYKSLESYFSTVQLLSVGARYYSTLTGYDFLSMKNHGFASPSSSLQSNQSKSQNEGSDASTLLSRLASVILEQETVEFSDIMDYTYHEDIPRLLQILCRRLIELKGYNEKGIFRISPGIDEYTQLKSKLSIVTFLRKSNG